MSAARFFCDQDAFGNTFVVPEARRVEWDEWTALDDRDERAWAAPTYAVRVLNPRRLSFENPVEAEAP